MPTTDTLLDGHLLAQDIGERTRAFAVSFSVIIFSEIGDKTFFIACIMAMRYSRLMTFSAAISALVLMTVLSVFLGMALPNIISKQLTQFLASMLFFIFGIKMLMEGWKMTGEESVQELDEVNKEIVEKTNEKKDITMERGGVQDQKKSNFLNLCHLLFSPAFVQTFILTFLGEWGDRSQIASMYA